MTFADIQEAVAYIGALAILAFMVAIVIREGWREIWKRSKCFAAVFAIGAVVATIQAQKPPVVRSMNLRISNVTAKGFDCSWDYGNLTPADFTSGETVRLTARVDGLDYNLIVGTLPVTVTNYHVNAVMRGLPRDWMRHNLEVTARCNNGLLTGSDTHHGEDNQLSSINDANGGNE